MREWSDLVKVSRGEYIVLCLAACVVPWEVIERRWGDGYFWTIGCTIVALASIGWASVALHTIFRKLPPK